MRIEINDAMQRQLGLVGWDSRHVDVKLHDGRVLKKLVIREGGASLAMLMIQMVKGICLFKPQILRKFADMAFCHFGELVAIGQKLPFKIESLQICEESLN